jgi:single-strand DNA-binding protein
MNHVVLVGNLTDDPTLRYTKSGKAVANFTLAVSHREDRNGRSQDVTDGFFGVTCWNALADNVAASFKKGSRALVAGRLIQRTFEVEGEKRTVIEIVASHVAAELMFATAEITKPEREKQDA